MNLADPRKQQLQHWLTQQQGGEYQDIQLVSGDASFRRYFRIFAKQQSYIAVDAPPKFENAKRFIEVAESYRDCGLAVPEVLAVDCQQGFYLQEDLGDTLLADVLSQQNCRQYYQSALALLPAIQSCVATQSGALPGFDQALLEREFGLFSHWLCEVHLQLQLTKQELQCLHKVCGYLQQVFFCQPQVGVHRDYHSRNLLLDTPGRLRVIDFQDAVLGPVTYDAVSLLRDCYQMWPDSIVYALLQQHWQEHHQQHPWTDFKRWFDLTGVQRHIKASGIFCRLYHRDGKAGYLADIPRTLQHLLNVAERYPEFDQFVGFVKGRVLPALDKVNK